MWKALFPVVVLYNYAGLEAEVWVTGNCPMRREYKHSYCWKRAGCFSRARVCHSETLLLRLQGWRGGNCHYLHPCIAGLSPKKTSGRTFQPLLAAFSTLTTEPLGSRLDAEASLASSPAAPRVSCSGAETPRSLAHHGLSARLPQPCQKYFSLEKQRQATFPLVMRPTAGWKHPSSSLSPASLFLNC